MYNLFKDVYAPKRNVTLAPEFDNIKNTYLSQILTVEQYYHNRVYAVKNQHLLVRLLNNLTTPMAYELEQYVRVTDTRAIYMSKSLGFTSPLSKGEVFNGVFYGPGVSEYIIYNDDYFNPIDAHNDWRNICAVKVLDHPKTDLGILLPNGRSMSYGEGIAVISININLLAVQYRAFCLDQYRRTTETGSMLGATHFIHMYVLPNMLYSHVDIAIINRLMALYYGAPIAKPVLKHAFSVHDYTNKVDNVLIKVINNLQAAPMPYVDMLRDIPSISQVNMLDTLILPEVAETMQIHWLIILTRLRYFKFLADIGGAEGVRRNSSDVGALKLVLKRLDGNNIWNSVLPKEILYDVKQLSADIQGL